MVLLRRAALIDGLLHSRRSFDLPQRTLVSNVVVEDQCKTKHWEPKPRFGMPLIPAGQLIASKGMILISVVIRRRASGKSGVPRLKNGAPHPDRVESDDVGIWPRLGHDGWMGRRSILHDHLALGSRRAGHRCDLVLTVAIAARAAATALIWSRYSRRALCARRNQSRRISTEETRNFWLKPRSSGIRIVSNREIKHVETSNFCYWTCQRYRGRGFDDLFSS